MTYMNLITIPPSLTLNEYTDDQMEVIQRYKQEIERLKIALARTETRAKNSEQILRDIRG